MPDSLYTSRSRIEVLGPLHRRAHELSGLGVGPGFGVHGAKHQGRCATAATLEGAATVGWTAEIVET